MAGGRVGLIVPYAEPRVPSEGLMLFPDVDFVAQPVPIRSLTIAELDAAARKIGPAAEALALSGVASIMVMGTSLTFCRGADFNREVEESVARISGVPTGTMSSAVRNALREMGGKRVAVVAAYADEVNRQLQLFLEANDIEIAALGSFGLVEFTAPYGKTADDITRLADTVLTEAPDADALLIACGGLKTLTLTPALETRFGIPVISSIVAGFWDAVRLAGLSSRAVGFGRLLEAEPAES